MPIARPLLEVRDLRVTFTTSRGSLRAVDGVDFSISQGEVLGLVGESGSGKTITLKAILRLLQPWAAIQGKVLWQDEDILTLPDHRLRTIRGGQIAMVFQEPMTALNPVLTIGAQIDEVIAAHSDLDRVSRRRRTIELLDQVGIPCAAARLSQFPHEFSGGMRQRAMIATALAGEPKLLLADEPTTALDVTIQDQILKLLGDLVAERGMAMILVTHDLGVVAESCDRVCVMYSGNIVEAGPVGSVFRHPKHGYTAALLASVAWGGAVRTPLAAIPGQPRPAGAPGQGCAFAPRCKYVEPACRMGKMSWREIQKGHETACLAAERIPSRNVPA
jgi:oligopeptide/dipeptide ABC transporter ATP-binding protein